MWHRCAAVVAVAVMAAGTLSPPRSRPATLVLDVTAVGVPGSIPALAEVHSTPRTLQALYATVGIDIMRRDATAPGPPGHTFTDAELHALLPQVNPIGPVESSDW